MTRERMACAVCGRVLDEIFEDDVSVGHIHARQDSGDHIAVPVPATELRVMSRCDFCNVDLPVSEPTWVLPVHDFEIVPGHLNRGNFGMCGECKDAFSPSDLKPLIARIAAAAPFGNMMGDPRVVGLYLKLVMHHAYGDPVLWDPESPVE